MPEELSGNALVRLCAEKVMGWPVTTNREPVPETYPQLRVCGDMIYVYPRLRGEDYIVWNPLASMEDAWEIVRAMQVRGFKYSLLGDREGETARFAIENNVMCDVFNGYALPGNPGEAICRAALKALECANR